MAGIVKGSINLSAIPKDKIIDGKKGKYLPITITVNDEVDQFNNQGPMIVSQSKEEREAQVVWSNGAFPDPPPRDGQPAMQMNTPKNEEPDLPF